MPMRESLRKGRVTQEERDLVFAVADGVPALIPLIGHIRIIAQDARDVSYMDILRWLYKNRITGQTMVEWMREKHDGSPLRAIAFVRMKVHSDFGVKKIFAKPI